MPSTPNAWALQSPSWASPVIDALKRLDLADARPPALPLDGKFLGTDLEAFARSYLQRGSVHAPRLLHVFNAAHALYQTWKPNKPEQSARVQEVKILENALFEGARAMLEERPPEYKKVEGFSSHFIDAEFAFYFEREILGHKGPSSDASWQFYWERLLQDCQTDLFISRRSCVFRSH